MAIVTASTLGIELGSRALFDEVSFKLETGDRMTLSGRNGAGKSTLLRILAGEAKPDTGSLAFRKGVRVALHDQRPPRDSGLGLRDYVLAGRNDMIETEAEMARLEQVMSAGDHDERTLRAYSSAQARLETAGGYRWRDGVLSVLAGLGFDEAEWERALATFSGGELTRASLARALAARPDLLLLDEPTNHLDIGTLEWLERYLLELDAAIVLVAHDRWFLEAVGTSVLELEAGRARYFSGPWHAWRKEKAARQIAIGRQIEKQEAEIARMERFVERFRYKATKARQAQERIKKIEKIKRDAASFDPRDDRRLGFEFARPERTSKIPLRLVNATIEVPGRTLLSGAEMLVERGEHLVLIGPNGAGKTTLMETLAGRREPASGTVRLGHNVEVGYLSQHAETASGEGTVLDAVTRGTGLSGQKARALLGAFLFSGDEARKPLSDISGGEQRRLSLAILVASGANVLMLDEPTNHLDIESREALEDALSGFEGVVILISHDRALLEAIGSRTLVCENGRLDSYPTDWATYQRERDEREAAARQAAERERSKRSGKASGKATAGNGSGSGGGADRGIGRLEERIARAERKLRELEDELSDPAAWSTPEKSERAAERHEAARREVAELYERWEAAAAL